MGQSRECSSAGAPFPSLLRHLRDRSAEPRNRFTQPMKLMNEFRQRLAHFKRDCLVAGLDQLGYPRLRSPVSAAQVLASGSHPVASVRFGRVAPSNRCSRSITSASLLPAGGASVLAYSPTLSGSETIVASERGRGCGASIGSITCSGGSSTAIAFRPPAVSLSA